MCIIEINWITMRKQISIILPPSPYTPENTVILFAKASQWNIQMY